MSNQVEWTDATKVQKQGKKQRQEETTKSPAEYNPRENAFLIQD